LRGLPPSSPFSRLAFALAFVLTDPPNLPIIAAAFETSMDHL
jgi:hypothetical protein